jgi:ESS family glutamate:Na+ symporter
MAAATFGLVAGSLIGGPIGRFLIEKNHLEPHPEQYDLDFVNGNGDEILTYDSLMKNFAFLLAAIGIGGVLANFFKNHGITLPAYVSSMIIAAIILNLGQFTQKWTINQKAVETIGAIGLNMFLSLALINLRLWELLDLAAPMLIILVSQTLIMAVYAIFVAYYLCGRDYDSAVITAGFCGFGMGATPNAMANMRSVVERFGEAPRAFFVVPIVGAFLIDFANAIVITTFINYII